MKISSGGKVEVFASKIKEKSRARSLTAYTKLCESSKIIIWARNPLPPPPPPSSCVSGYTLRQVYSLQFTVYPVFSCKLWTCCRLRSRKYTLLCLPAADFNLFVSVSVCVRTRERNLWKNYPQRKITSKNHRSNRIARAHTGKLESCLKIKAILQFSSFSSGWVLITLCAALLLLIRAPVLIVVGCVFAFDVQRTRWSLGDSRIFSDLYIKQSFDGLWRINYQDWGVSFGENINAMMRRAYSACTFGPLWSALEQV